MLESKKNDAVSNDDCPCKRTGCIRHGNCEECREYHAKRGIPPKCEQGRNKKHTK